MKKTKGARAARPKRGDMWPRCLGSAAPRKATRASPVVDVPPLSQLRTRRQRALAKLIGEARRYPPPCLRCVRVARPSASSGSALTRGALHAGGGDQPAPVVAADGSERAQAVVDAVGMRRDRLDLHRRRTGGAVDERHALELDGAQRGELSAELVEAVAERGSHRGSGKPPGGPVVAAG